jgi:hypothetical protein
MTALPFDCSSLDCVFISFSNELLNNVAQDDAHDFQDFFDEDTPTNLADDLLDVLHKQVEILLENSSTDHQAARLPSIMRKLFRVYETDSSNGSPRLRNQAKMERAFQETVLRGDTVVKIIVLCDLLHFHPDCQGNDHDMICTAHAELQSVTIPAPPPVGVTSIVLVTTQDSMSSEPLLGLGSRLSPFIDTRVIQRRRSWNRSHC